MKLLLHNGKLISESTLIGLNRAMYYGDGFFESIRLIEGSIHLLDVHLKRMQFAFKELGLIKNESFSRSALERSLLKLAEANELSNGKIRLTVFRKGAGAYIPESDEVEWIAELTPIEQEKFEINRKGLLVDVYKKQELPKVLSKPYKSLNAAFYIGAGRFARDKKVNEVFVINEQQEIVESIYSNVFYQKGAQLYTTPVESGGLPGVMRAYLIHLLQKQDIEVLEKPLGMEELYEVDELFLTNAIRGIQWVAGYNSKRFYSRYIREYSNLLNKSVKKTISA